MNKKILAISMTLLISIILVAMLVESVPAKPTTATVDFRIETCGDVNDQNPKMKLFPAGESENNMGHWINIIGNWPLLDGVAPTIPDFLAGRGGVRLIIDPEGSDPYTLEGSVDQVLMPWVIVSGGMFSVERSTFTISYASENAPDDAIGSTLELSLHAKNGIGRIVGNRGTGIFENAQFRGTYTMTPIILPVPFPPYQAVFKVQEGTGEIMFN